MGAPQRVTAGNHTKPPPKSRRGRFRRPAPSIRKELSVRGKTPAPVVKALRAKGGDVLAFARQTVGAVIVRKSLVSSPASKKSVRRSEGVAFQDRVLRCSNCGRVFMWSVGKQEYFQCGKADG